MSKREQMLKIGRRGVLGAFATLTGGLILRSLATGIPARVLLNPLAAKAAPNPAKVLILSSSASGDPVNANVPGTYITGVSHSADPAMAATNMKLGSLTTKAAKPWASLPQGVLNQTCFFHHATYTPVHGEMGRVQRMMDETEKHDMLISIIARELAQSLGSVQSDPVSLGASGSELLSSAGRVMANVAPTSVRNSLGGVEGPLKSLTEIRDESIDEIYALYKQHGTPSQRAMLDDWARSRDEVRDISSTLVSKLDAISGNDAANQVKTAAVLAAMNITPVITIRLRFGGDNHADAGLARETKEHISALQQIKTLMQELDQLKTVLKHDVIFGSLNVFGRTLKKKGTAGRDHNSNHHVTVLMGKGIKPGVVGGIQLDKAKKDYQATTINSNTGKPGGDIAFEDTLNSMGKTLGVALGVSESRMDEILPSGKVVKSAIA